jgi:HPt (histidine-containing phosphotransfer) domain-containing protein
MQDVTPVVEIEAELADLIPQYLSNRRADLHAAQDMLAEGDFRAIARLAHRIRGSAASYGFGQLGDIVGRLEMAADQADAAAIDAQLAAYADFLRGVRIHVV